MARKKKVAREFQEPALEATTTESAEIGMTSQEAPGQGAGQGAAVEKKSKFSTSSLLQDFSIYDALLLSSLVFVTLATLRVFFAMTQYGGYFWDKPWNP